MKRLIESIITGVILTLLLKALEKYGSINIMESIYQNFIKELWPIWIGLLVAISYWIIRDYIQLRRFNSGLKKWIGLFSYKDKEKGGYSDLKGKVKLYIKEELEKANKINNP